MEQIVIPDPIDSLAQVPINTFRLSSNPGVENRALVNDFWGRGACRSEGRLGNGSKRYHDGH